MRLQWFTFMLLFAGSALAAPKRVAVLPLQNQADVSAGEVGYLTNLVRKGAMRTLDVKRFTVMTQENMEAMLPPGKTLADCVAKASCAVDIGKEMKAHYVVTGELVRFGKSLRLSVKVHVTSTNGFLEQIDAKGGEVEVFESALETQSPVLFAAIETHAGGGAPSLGAGAVVGGEAPAASAFQVGGGSEAVLRFESTPAKAQVTLNGAVVCFTPCSKAVPTGRHRVAMSELGYVIREENVAVSGSQTVAWTLVKNRGRLKLTSTPSGQRAEILGYGDPIPGEHKTPVDVAVPPGVYEVAVGEAPCAKVHRKLVTIEIGKTVAADFKPAILPAGLKVNVKDPKGNDVEGQLFAGGKLLGPTTQTHSLPVCSKNIEVRVKGHTAIPVTTALVAEKTAEITLSLTGSPFRVGQIWRGHYRCRQGRTDLELEIRYAAGSEIQAVFYFDYRQKVGETRKRDDAARGSFHMEGTYDSAARRLRLEPGVWIKRPGNYQSVGMSGVVTAGHMVIFEGKITRKGCGKFSLRRAGTVDIKERIKACKSACGLPHPFTQAGRDGWRCRRRCK